MVWFVLCFYCAELWQLVDGGFCNTQNYRERRVSSLFFYKQNLSAKVQVVI